MENNLGVIRVEFNNGAKKIFFHLYQQFDASAKVLDPKIDNNVLQLLKGKYLSVLNHELKTIAKKLIGKYNTPDNSDNLEKALTEDINMFVNEFCRKTERL